MSLTCTRGKIVWAGELQRMEKLDSNFKSLHRKDSIHSMIGVMRRCGGVQARLIIQKLIQWWKSTVPRHSNPLPRYWCMSSGLKTMILNRMWHIGWSKLHSPGWSGDGQHRNSRMGHHFFQYWRRNHILLILNRLRTWKSNSRPLCRDTLHGVLQKHGGYIYGGRNVSHCNWKTPRIRMTFLDNGMMKCYLIFRWILQFLDCSEIHW